MSESEHETDCELRLRKGFNVVLASRGHSRFGLGRLLGLVLFASALAGCGLSDLSRLDREARASWSAVVAADRLSADIVRLLLDGRHAAVASRPLLYNELAGALADFDARSGGPPRDVTDIDGVRRYALERGRLIDGMKRLAIQLANRETGMRAWRSRSLRSDFEAAVLRSETAGRNFNDAVRAYNSALGGGRSAISKALLFPGTRRLALLEPAGPDTARRESN